jgi:hypothetical protein
MFGVETLIGVPNRVFADMSDVRNGIQNKHMVQGNVDVKWNYMLAQTSHDSFTSSICAVFINQIKMTRPARPISIRWVEHGVSLITIGIRKYYQIALTY